MITCQRTPTNDDFYHGRPGHGLQQVITVWTPWRQPEWVYLACGCSFPVSWVPTHEREQLKNLPVWKRDVLGWYKITKETRMIQWLRNRARFYRRLTWAKRGWK